MRKRRYRLRESALEVFLRRGKRRSLFVDFGSELRDQGRRNDFIRALETRVSVSRHVMLCLARTAALVARCIYSCRGVQRPLMHSSTAALVAHVVGYGGRRPVEWV